MYLHCVSINKYILLSRVIGWSRGWDRNELYSRDTRAYHLTVIDKRCRVFSLAFQFSRVVATAREERIPFENYICIYMYISRRDFVSGIHVPQRSKIIIRAAVGKLFPANRSHRKRAWKKKERKTTRDSLARLVCERYRLILSLPHNIFFFTAENGGIAGWRHESRSIALKSAGSSCLLRSQSDYERLNICEWIS